MATGPGTGGAKNPADTPDDDAAIRHADSALVAQDSAAWLHHWRSPSARLQHLFEGIRISLNRKVGYGLDEGTDGTGD